MEASLLFYGLNYDKTACLGNEKIEIEDPTR